MEENGWMDAACLDEAAFGEIDPHDEDLLVLVWNWVVWAEDGVPS